MEPRNNYCSLEDCFDSLPDDLLLLIFNKVGDAKSLTRFLAVSKRFAFLVSNADTVFLSVPPKNAPNSSKDTKPRNGFTTLVKRFVAKALVQNFVRRKSAISSDASGDDVPYYSPNDVLKRFKQVKSMHVQLPPYGGEIGHFSGSGGGDDNSSLLKWRAEFGSQLTSCAILGANSFQKNDPVIYDKFKKEAVQSLRDNEMKLRVVWTISCLIAASSRHHLLKQILTEHELLESVAISDVNKQGKLCMGKEQIDEMRESVMAAASSPERARLPDLRIKMWYVPVLELPRTGHLMSGATLIMVRPVDDGATKVDGRLFGFDGKECEKTAIDEACRVILKTKKSYVMTMNSF